MSDGTVNRAGRTPPGILRRTRLCAGMRLVDVAESASVSAETIRRLELGAHRPTWDTAVRVARALGQDDPRGLFPELLDEKFTEESGGAKP